MVDSMTVDEILELGRSVLRAIVGHQCIAYADGFGKSLDGFL